MSDTRVAYAPGRPVAAPHLPSVLRRSATFTRVGLLGFQAITLNHGRCRRPRVDAALASVFELGPRWRVYADHTFWVETDRAMLRVNRLIEAG